VSSRKVEIQERIKQIAFDMKALLGEESYEMTEEEENQYLSLEKEGETLEVELEEIRQAEVVSSRRQRADSLMANATQSTRKTTPNQTGRIGRVKLSIEDDPNRGFKNFAHFAMECKDFSGNMRGSELIMNVAAGTGMQQSISSDGGALVPPAFSTAIWDRVQGMSESMMGYCDVVPVDLGNESVTVPAINESSRVDGSRQGGIRGYWKSELSLMTSSKMSFRETKLTPQELYVFAYVSDKLLRNSPSTAADRLEKGCADEIAFKIGASVFGGTGSGQPTGIIGHPATVSISKETGQAAATLTIQNIAKMYARLHAKARSGAVWFINQDVESALNLLTFPVGTGGVPVYLPPGGLSAAPYATLYGKPVVPVEYCETLGTVGDIVLANLSFYAMAIKGTPNTAWSMHLKFDYAQSAFRIIFEVDGQPWLEEAITPYKGTATTSPIITLNTRA
jgi:HK97 family phage major capsid protein